MCLCICCCRRTCPKESPGWSVMGGVRPGFLFFRYTLARSLMCLQIFPLFITSFVAWMLSLVQSGRRLHNLPYKDFIPRTCLSALCHFPLAWTSPEPFLRSFLQNRSHNLSSPQKSALLPSTPLKVSFVFAWSMQLVHNCFGK